MREGALRVLVIDEEAGIRDLFHFLLEPLGHEVRAVADGRSALAELVRRRFDLVFLDVPVPQRRADTLARIASLRPDQRVVVVSGAPEVDPETLPGACAHVRKPFGLDEIIALLPDAGEDP